MKTALFLLIALLGLPCGRGLALPAGDIRALVDWSDLPVLDNSVQVEATNTRGPNTGKLVDAAPGQCALLEEKGPGCLTRISIFSAQGTLKVYFDGAATPQIDIPLAKLYQQYPFYDPNKWPTVDADKPQVFPFLLPLSTAGFAQKNACYLPMPFARSVRVVWEHDPANPWGQYSISYLRFPDGTSVQSYTSAALQARENDVKTVAAAWRAMGKRPMTYPDERRQAGTLVVPPKSTVDLWTATGDGVVVALRLRARPWHRAVDRLLVLRAYWDGEQKPSIESPIGDFCAGHAGARQGLVLPVGGGGKDGWYWCYLPMPFDRGAHLTLENMSVNGITALEYEIVTRPGPPAAGRLCARWKRETLAEDEHYTLLQVTGAGKLIGYNLYAAGFPVPMKNYRQSDRMALYRDDETDPAFAGAGLLMYFNNGWYTGSTWDSPLFANAEMDNFIYGTYADYRYFLNDAPTWKKNVRLVMEVKPDEQTARDFSSVAYWYHVPGATDTFTPLTRENLLLPVRHFPNSIEAEDLLKTAKYRRGDLVLVDDPDGRYGAGNNRFISFAPLGYGDTLTLHFAVETAGDYTVSVRLIAGPSGGYWGAAVNGVIVDPKAPPFPCAYPETTLASWYHPNGFLQLGQYALKAGDNTLTFTARSPGAGVPQRGLLLGLDALLVTPVMTK